jgi:heme/copper-type cytochrome/quinol oxidase subunit 2
MPLVAQAAIVIGVAVVSVALLWAARRSPWNERFAGEVGEHDKAFDFLGTAFAVLLAFVVLEAYESYNDAKSGRKPRPKPSWSCHARRRHSGGTSTSASTACWSAMAAR